MISYQKKITCSIEQDTKVLAEKISEIAQKGDVFALYGTLGAGKSTFARYFIQHLTSAQDIPSPTFTLVQTYETSSFDIYHYDMYRLKSPEEAYELDIEDAFYSAVSLVEWPEKISALLPRDLWKVSIETSGNKRIFSFETTSLEKKQRLERLFADG